MKAAQSFLQRHGFTIFVLVALLALYIYFKPKEQLPAFLVPTPDPTHVGAPLLGQDEFNSNMDEFLNHPDQTRWLHLVGSSIDGALDLSNQWLTTVEDWKVGFLLNGNGMHVDDWLPEKPILIVVPIAEGNGFAIQRLLDHVLADDVPVQHKVRVVFISPELPPSLRAIGTKPYQATAHPALTPSPLTQGEVNEIADGLWDISQGNRGLVSLAMQEIDDHGALESKTTPTLLANSKKKLIDPLGAQYESADCLDMVLVSALTLGFDRDDVQYISPPPNNPFSISDRCKTIASNERHFTASVSPSVLNNYLVVSELNRRKRFERSGLWVAWALRPEETRFSISSTLQLGLGNGDLLRSLTEPQLSTVDHVRSDNWQYWIGMHNTLLDNKRLTLEETQNLLSGITQYKQAYIYENNEFCYREAYDRSVITCTNDKQGHTGDHSINAAAIHALANSYALGAAAYQRLNADTNVSHMVKELKALEALIPESTVIKQRMADTIGASVAKSLVEAASESISK